jgi:hypothetical protein
MKNSEENKFDVNDHLAVFFLEYRRRKRLGRKVFRSNFRTNIFGGEIVDVRKWYVCLAILLSANFLL